MRPRPPRSRLAQAFPRGERRAVVARGTGCHTGAMDVGQQSFATLLRQLRERSGLTQERLAERAAISAKAISALERGERQHPYPHTVRALAAALQLSAEEAARLKATIPPREQAGPVRAPLPAAPSPLIGREVEVEAV